MCKVQYCMSQLRERNFGKIKQVQSRVRVSAVQGHRVSAVQGHTYEKPFPE